MANIETIPQTTEPENAIVPVAEVHGVSPEAYGEHEVSDLKSAAQDETNEIGTPADGAPDDDVIHPAVTQGATQPGDTPKDAAPVSKPEVTKKLTASNAAATAGKDKPVISARTASTKSGPPTPTVKKVRLPHLNVM